MSASVGDDKSYLGQNLSICQLLHVAKRKLQGAASCGRFVRGSCMNEPKPESCWVVPTVTLGEAEVRRQGRVPASEFIVAYGVVFLARRSRA